MALLARNILMTDLGIVNLYLLEVLYCSCALSSLLKNIRNSLGMGVSNCICSLVMGW